MNSVKTSSFLVFIFIFIFIFILHSASAQTTCQINTTYAANVNATLSSLSRTIDNTGYLNVSVGRGIDRVNAIAFCRSDVQLNECRDCVEAAAKKLLENCPYPVRDQLMEGPCTLRYSNSTVYGVVESSVRVYAWSTQNATSPEEFEADLRGLIGNLTNQAASGGSIRKVAAANVTAPDFQTIFALVQCSPDLSSENCVRCLSEAAGDIPLRCDRKKGCRVSFASCNLQFDISRFFNATRLQELEPVPTPVPVPGPGPGLEQPLQPSPGKSNGNTTRNIIIIVVPVAVSLILAACAVVLLRKRRRQQKQIEPSSTGNPHPGGEISTAESLQYAFNTIKTATNDFSDENKLGEGGFGAVYKGILANGQEIAVKRLSMNSGQGNQEFKNEVLLLVRLQHRNLVRLLGFALEGTEKLLVYEFVQNASLDHFIFGPSRHSYLDWDRRYKIIAGIARGILYLHEDSRLRIIHRDLKASNILLDGDMNPKIADFGTARLFGQDETQGNTSRIVGTYGYMSPEYLLHGQFSIKSDVFSFGVLVLEIISGHKNNNTRSGQHIEDLLSFTWKNWLAGTAGNVIEPSLRSGSGSTKDVLRCIQIGLLCVQQDAADRPTMASVVLMLSSESITLAVPSEPAFYFSGGYSARQEDNPADPVHGGSSSGGDDRLSQNDDSVSDLYPR